MKKAFLVLLSVVFVSGCQDSQTASEDSNAFHKVNAKAPEAGTMFLYPERIPLKDGGLLAAERGLMFVPVNRSDPKSAVISVEVYRFKASEKAKPGTPPIFYFHGGPSFSGLERSLRNPGTFEERWQPLTDVSDVVVIGQRGIGSSKPTTLVETTVDFPIDQDVAEEQIEAAIQAANEREMAFWREQGLDLKGFTVIEAAADVDDVRKAFGYNKIIIWGGSFGSHWGMAYMRNYPDYVERAIFRGMEGPNHTYDHPGHLWKVYERIAEEAEAFPGLRDLIPEGGLLEAAKAVAMRVRTQPLKLVHIDPETGESHDVLLTAHDAGRLARGYFSRLSAWPAAIINFSKGDFSIAAERAVNWSGRRQFGTASFYMLDHGSGITAEREQEMMNDPAYAILGDINSHYTMTRDVWGSDLGDEFRQNFDTEIPTVIVHGTWDTSTPYENALELIPHFKNSKFITVIRGPHSAIRAAMSASEQFRIGIYHFAATGDMSQLPDEVEMPEVEWVIPGQDNR